MLIQHVPLKRIKLLVLWILHDCKIKINVVWKLEKLEILIFAGKFSYTELKVAIQ